MINILDKNIQELLCDALKQSIKEPIKRKKFRLDNRDKKEYINFLENAYILRVEEDANSKRTYSVQSRALFLADCTLSHEIFTNIDNVCGILRQEYEADDNDEVRVPVKKILDRLSLNINDFLVCYKYLDKHISMGRTTDLTQEEAYICPIERLFEFDNFSDLPKNMLMGQYPDAFNIKDPNKKTHGNTIVNDKKREAILGAALSVLAAFPNQCKTQTTGKIKGSKISKLIEEKGLLLFPEYDGEPPLEHDSMTREINKWLKVFEKIQ